jgi:hypothetical protein
MNSTLKYTGLLALMAAVVFGATLISQYSFESPKAVTGGGGDPAKIDGMPLRFTNNEMSYDPGSSDLGHRSFQGFYEMGTNQVPVSFWFTNPHPVPVSVAVLHRSCSQCSSARLAVVPAAGVQTFLARSAVGSLTPSGLFTGLAAVSLVQSLPWQNFDLENPDKGIVVPPASDDGAPTWGVLQFGIDIRVNGTKRLGADVACTAGDNPQARMIFNMTVFGTEPFEVYPQALAFGDLPEGTAPQTKNLYFWSATRDTEDLKGLKVTVGDDPFLRVGKPQPMEYEELAKLAAERAASGQKLTRIQGGYKIPVTMYRQRPASASAAAAASGPDIGPFEQRIGFSLPGTTHAVQIPVSATITGLVGFADGSPTVVDLKSFRALAGAQKTVALVSDRADLELSPAPKGTTPAALGVKLSAPRTDSGRRHWALTVTVPGGAVVGALPSESVVVLLAKTSDGVQRVRIPVKGRASTR